MVEKKYSYPLLKITTFRVAKLIFQTPHTVFHVRKLAKETELSTTAVLQAVKELEEAGIVMVEKTELTTNIKANLGSETYLSYKRIFNLYLLEQCKVVSLLYNTLHPKAIVLFGSYARGEDEEESDIDFLIISHTKTDEKLKKELLRCEETLGRKISLHILHSLEKSSKEFKNSIANGIVLSGYVKVV